MPPSGATEQYWLRLPAEAQPTRKRLQRFGNARVAFTNRFLDRVGPETLHFAAAAAAASAAAPPPPAAARAPDGSAARELETCLNAGVKTGAMPPGAFGDARAREFYTCKRLRRRTRAVVDALLDVTAAPTVAAALACAGDELRVCSVGGGPAFDLVAGAVVAAVLPSLLSQEVPPPTAAPGVVCEVFDNELAWAGCAAAVARATAAAASGGAACTLAGVRFGDLAAPVADNPALAAALRRAHVVSFAYCLHENGLSLTGGGGGGDGGGGTVGGCLPGVFAAAPPGQVLVFVDSTYLLWPAVLRTAEAAAPSGWHGVCPHAHAHQHAIVLVRAAKGRVCAPLEEALAAAVGAWGDGRAAIRTAVHERNEERGRREESAGGSSDAEDGTDGTGEDDRDGAREGSAGGSSDAEDGTDGTGEDDRDGAAHTDLDTLVFDYYARSAGSVVQTAGLRAARRKRVGPYIAVFDDAHWAHKRGHVPATPPAVPVDRPFDTSRFNFNKVASAERIASVLAAKHPVLVNLSPLMVGHTVVPLFAERELPQGALGADGVRAMFDLAALSRRGDFRVGYNSNNAFASVNHLHVHGMYCSNLDGAQEGGGAPPDEAACFPIEQASRTCVGTFPSGATASLLRGYLVGGLVVSGGGSAAVAKAAAAVVGRVQSLGHAFNVLVRAGLDPAAFVVPRRGQEAFDVAAAGCNAAVCELCGYLVMQSAGTFEALEEGALRDYFGGGASLTDQELGECVPP